MEEFYTLFNQNNLIIIYLFIFLEDQSSKLDQQDYVFFVVYE